MTSKVYEKALFQDYEYHLNTNASDIIALLTTKIESVISGFNSILQLAVSAIVAFFITTTLIIIDWQISLLALLVTCGTYFVISLLTKKTLYLSSKRMDATINKKYQIFQEGFGSIKEILLTSIQFRYLNLLHRQEIPYRKSKANIEFLRTFPKYLLEFILITFLTGFSLIIFNSPEENIKNIIPLLGTFALGSQKLLPVLQLVYNNWANIKGKSESILKVLNYMNIKNTFLSSKIDKRFMINRLEFKEIIFDSVYFKYKIKDIWASQNLSFNIKRGEKIGIIGKTGSGKSTIINLLIGLLNPTKGAIKVNSKNLLGDTTSNFITRWRSTISYVPQEIYLIDSSIAENVAFGQDFSNIDFKLLNKSLKNAKILDFIESLPNGIKTNVGENGIQLSGGQRQRIGIARAIYKNAQVIILDEATSALDSKTETEVLDYFNKIEKEITVIMIAHRISSLKKCNRIFEINKGNLANVYQNSDFFSSSK